MFRFWRRFYLIVENVVLEAKSNLNDFASKDSERYWSTGVLECWKKQIPRFIYNNSPFITPLLHDPITPGDFRTKERPTLGAAQRELLLPVSDS